MSVELFAIRVIAGDAAVSPRTRWWPLHTLSVGRYVRVCAGRHDPGAKAVRDAAAAISAEWERAQPRSNGLMSEHAALEMALADAAASRDSSGAGRAAGWLLENAREQARLYGRIIADFPEAAFLRMLREHSVLLAQEAHPDKAAPGLRDEVRRNTLAMARFTAEWL